MLVLELFVWSLWRNVIIILRLFQPRSKALQKVQSIKGNEGQDANYISKYLIWESIACSSGEFSKRQDEGRLWEAHTYDGQPASMWPAMSHKSSSIFSLVMAERDELLPKPPHLHHPLHLIHMSICLLSMPLSKDHWCPAFDIWHTMCHNVSPNELNQKRKKQHGCHHIPKSLTISSVCVSVLVVVLLRFRSHIGKGLSDLCRTLASHPTRKQCLISLPGCRLIISKGDILVSFNNDLIKITQYVVCSSEYVKNWI